MVLVVFSVELNEKFKSEIAIYINIVKYKRLHNGYQAKIDKFVRFPKNLVVWEVVLDSKPSSSSIHGTI